MTKEEASVAMTKSVFNNKCTIFEAATGYGKTKVCIDAIQYIKGLYPQDKHFNILLLVNQIVHKTVWRDEFLKWNESLWNDMNITYTVECYDSLHKYEYNTFDIVVCDEAHHLSEARLDSLHTLSMKYLICLSATMPRQIKATLKRWYKTNVISCTLHEAIQEDILPQPHIYLIPMKLDNNTVNQVIIKNPKGTKIYDIPYTQKWNIVAKNDIQVKIHCTELQYYNDLCSQIDYWKRKTISTSNQIFKGKWMKVCTERLKWLSDKKTSFIYSLLVKLDKYRTLTFCNSITQTEELGENCINSKNKLSSQILNNFNEGTINHITSCNMLNESVNLVDCKIGIFANLNASEIITAQRQGRLLRHKKPVIIIPYYISTREEEIVKSMLEGYNTNYIHTTTFDNIITDIKDND